MTGFTARQRRLIRDRDRVCVVHYRNYDPDCHYLGCGGGLVAHHRVNRGMGGSRARNRVANGLWICAVANTLLEMDPVFAEYARARGWKLRHDSQIETVPVWVPHAQRHFFLDDHGRYLADGTREAVTAAW